jgi:hypothetical protein
VDTARTLPISSIFHRFKKSPAYTSFRRGKRDLETSHVEAERILNDAVLHEETENRARAGSQNEIFSADLAFTKK